MVRARIRHGIAWCVGDLLFEHETHLTVANNKLYAVYGNGRVAMTTHGDVWTEVSIGASREDQVGEYLLRFPGTESQRRDHLDADSTGQVIVNGEDLTNIGEGGGRGGGTNAHFSPSVMEIDRIEETEDGDIVSDWR